MISEHTRKITQTCYACEREWQSQHDNVVPSWDELTDEQRDDKLLQVEFLLTNPSLGAAAVHDNWIKRRASPPKHDDPVWKYGPRFDEELKTDPRMMPFGRLSPVEQTVGMLYRNIVAVLGRV